MTGAGAKARERQSPELPRGSLLGAGRVREPEGPASFRENGPLRDIDGWLITAPFVSMQPAHSSCHSPESSSLWGGGDGAQGSGFRGRAQPLLRVSSDPGLMD